jgi:hypothetical protein
MAASNHNLIAAVTAAQPRDVPANLVSLLQNNQPTKRRPGQIDEPVVVFLGRVCHIPPVSCV